MAARSIWNGTLRIGRRALPVKLYSAVEDRTIHFHLLHAKDRQRLEQRMVDPTTGRPVAPDETLRGVETKAGAFVLLEKDELPEPREEDHEIEVTRFVPRTVVEPAWYDRPYYLGPRDGGTDCTALAAALERSGRVGIARWTMRKKEYVGGLLPGSGFLVLSTLHHAGQVVSAAELPRPAGRDSAKNERAMAEQLVAALEGEFDPAEFHDEYRERLERLLEAKARGRRFAFAREKKEKRPDDLARALAASLARVKRGREKISA